MIKKLALWCAVLCLALLAGCGEPQTDNNPTEASTAAQPVTESLPEPTETTAPPPTQGETETTSPPETEPVTEKTEPPTVAATPPATTAPPPEPVNTEDQTVAQTDLTCTLIIRCDTALAGDALPEEIREILPEDGIILQADNVMVKEGESVFDLLLQEARAAKVHLEHVKTPVYGSAYIEGIGNLYEFDCGPLSGWMYKVDGWFPNYGCSRYVLTQGCVVEWVYTCDLGADIGGEGASIGGGDE